MRLVPRSFAGRLILLLLLALLVAQAIAFALFAHERSKAVRQVYRETVVARTASVVRLLAEAPRPAHPRILSAASTRALGFRVDAQAAANETSSIGPARFIANALARGLGLPRDRVRAEFDIAFRSDDDDERDDYDERDEYEEHDDDEDHRFERHEGKWAKYRWLTLSVAMPDGRWLNVLARAPPGPPPIGLPFFISLFLSALAVALVAILAARRLSGPLRDLAQAADQAGRGETVPTLVESGPDEIRRSVRAFNRMHERLNRFVRDRTAMLAAISHDLRTPITSLRLRAEFVEDPATRAKIIDTLDEMQEMTEATLAFVREDAAPEDTRTVDITALVDSVVADLAELGHRVTFEDAPRVVLACRPMALRRALRNLIENAATHGQKATVSLTEENHEVLIVIEDRGPGIAEADRQRVFEPFIRLDPSRGQDTGGIGLGLAIARSIVRNHGGDIELENRPEGGLRVSVRLPLSGGGS